MVSSPLLIHSVTIKTISGIALPRICSFVTARLAIDGKLRVSKIYGVVDNVNAAARFVNASFNRPDLFSLLGGYMYHSHRCRQLRLCLSL